jgi:hypothetical protein
MQKFQSVSIIDTLRKIVDSNTLFYKKDFEYDAETLQTAAPGSHFLWQSRKSGTNLYHERDVHIQHNYAHNAWGYYSVDSQYYGIKAFAVEITHNHTGSLPIGNIYELHYGKHAHEVRQNSFKAKSVDVTFAPTKWESEATRTVDIAEYKDNWSAITAKYGEAKSIHHNLDKKDEARLAEILAAMRLEREQESTPASVYSYIKEMERKRFHEYGYKRDDMVFTTPEDAQIAVTHSIPVYVLYPDNTALQVDYSITVDDAVFEGRLFGMNEKDKRLLNFYKKGNTLADLPFTRNELKTILYMSFNKGKEHIDDEKEKQAIDGIIYILDNVLFYNDDSRDEKSREQDNDLDESEEYEP